MNTAQVFNLVLNVLMIITFVAGMWIAGKVLPRLIAWILPQNLQDLFSQPVGKTVLWLCLGSLFSLPLKDLVTILADLIQVALYPTQAINSAAGIVSIQVYVAFYLLLTVIIYGTILWFTRKFMQVPSPLTAAERTLIVLSAAGLISQGVHLVTGSVNDFSLFPLLSQRFGGTTAFILQTILSWLLLGIILMGLSSLLYRQPVENDDNPPDENA
jgi:hypothetical protein